jgi:hypothetical protein
VHKYDWRSPRLLACNFSVSEPFPAVAGRYRPYGRRTQESVESPRTLVHVPPEWEPSRAQEPPRRLTPRNGARPAGSDRAPSERVLGRYRLIERLGRGGFGEVWSAHDELLHREVAVKRIWLGPDGDSERATREALAAARLSHPAIVALYEASALQDAFFLISELVHGETLAQLISAGTLQDEEVLEIGVALCDALAHAHARGVIHRDIKPQNVLVPDRPEGPAGAAKLTDFGGASLVGEDALTRTGDVLGTLAYMAPEQSEGREVREEADLYALALVLYEALCGVNPVRGATPAATARRIGGRLEPLERRRRELPRALTRSLDLALSPSPRDRGTLAQLHLALQEALERGLGRTRRRRGEPRRGEVAPQAPAGSPLEQQALPARAIPADLNEAADQRLPARAARLSLPRFVWLACALAAVIWQAGAGRPGVAMLLLAALLPLLALPRRATPAWLGAAGAPILGLAGLAGAFPAIAGQAARWRQRAALGALGYWWLTLAEPLVGRLWLGTPSPTPARAVWESSLATSWTHVLSPMLSLGALLGALLWAGGAVTLPWVVRGQSAALDVLGATVLSALLAAAAPMLDAGLAASGGAPSPRGVVLGAVLGGMFAVAARALRGPV